MFTLLRQELPKGFNQAFESAPGPEPQNNNQGSLPDPQVAGASGFYLPAVLPAVPQLARDSLSQGLLETWLHPSSVGPLLIGPTCTVNHRHPSALKPPPSVTAPFSLTSFTDNPDHFSASLPSHCLPNASYTFYPPDLPGRFLPTEAAFITFFPPTESLQMVHIFLTGNNDA